MKICFPVLKLQMGTTRQSLGCPGVLDLVGNFIMPIFRYLLVFTAYLIGALVNLHMKTNDRRTDNNPSSEVDAYGSDLFHRVTFCWLIK